MNSQPLLQINDITKHYPGVLALDRVSLELRAGEVHCLVGENGAGKSTLVKILGGAISRDSGSIVLDGAAVRIDSPSAAQKLGIRIIYQDFKLVDELSVAENILLGKEPVKNRWGFIDTARLHARARDVLSLLGEPIDTSARVRSLSAAHRQIVEIAKAISEQVRILILDEPSASLTEHELQTLFSIIRKLRDTGVGILYISHRLNEIFEIGGRVTVLRDGRVVETRDISGVDRQTLIGLMVGREVAQEFPKSVSKRGPELLRVERLSTSKVRDISFSVSQGEVFGLAGLVGAGRSELASALFGVMPLTEGSILLDGIPVRFRSPREAIQAGIGFLTEDRNRYGLVLSMNVRENISLAKLGELASAFLIDREREKALAVESAGQLKIKTPSVETNVEALSGGNRQKVVLARWLAVSSQVLIFDEPTAGIDVGAKFEIYRIINELAGQGKAIIMISSDLPELVGLCDRIGVLCEGRMTGILSRTEASQEALLALATQFQPKPARA